MGGDGDGMGGDGDTMGGDDDCAAIESKQACDAADGCQSVVGQPVMPKGDNGWCVGEYEFLGCIPEQGCADAETFFCSDGEKFRVPDTCGPPGFNECEAPGGDGLGAC